MKQNHLERPSINRGTSGVDFAIQQRLVVDVSTFNVRNTNKYTGEAVSVFADNGTNWARSRLTLRDDLNQIRTANGPHHVAEELPPPRGAA